ncbi:MAG TPA: response regulator [Thiotrichaceae bacterium]|jgi:CheY-like chemotaxis protein|nr:response regulator [Thiotrichaceae bacterium]
MSSKDSMLIVDDSKLARMIIRGFASESLPDMEIVEAANGEEALEISNGKQFTVMTIDYNMPGINGLGLELAQKLKDASPNAHISLITANIQVSIQKRTEEMKINFIPKPINEEKIINFLNSRG